MLSRALQRARKQVSPRPRLLRKCLSPALCINQRQGRALVGPL